jgi:hypothetical protein
MSYPDVPLQHPARMSYLNVRHPSAMSLCYALKRNQSGMLRRRAPRSHHLGTIPLWLFVVRRPGRSLKSFCRVTRLNAEYGRAMPLPFRSDPDSV